MEDRQSIFREGDLVMITISGIEANAKFCASIPVVEFVLGAVYTVEKVGKYGDGWNVLVEGSTQFVPEKYFKFAFPEEMELKNIEYIVEDGYSIIQLEQKVNKRIQEGYQLQGGITLAITMGISVYAQALIKRKK